MQAISEKTQTSKDLWDVQTDMYNLLAIQLVSNV